MAGYSEAPLIKKLGLKENMNIQLINAPPDYIDLLEKDISDQLVHKTGNADLVHIFSTSRKEMEETFRTVIQQAKDGLIIWISWHKKSSGIATDITEDSIRELVLPKGWVDIKVCAVSDIWSGLKIVRRKPK